MKFLRLTTKLINMSAINSVSLKPEMYHIYVRNNDIQGIFMIGFGHISSGEERIDVCKKENPADYLTVTKWLDTVN